MNWIERLYELKGKDLYSQNGEGFILEYISEQIPIEQSFIDIGGGDGFYLSNTRHLTNLGWSGLVLDRENGIDVNRDNCNDWMPRTYHDSDGILTLVDRLGILSIDIDGNDYFILDEMLDHKPWNPKVVVAEFNAMYTDSRTIKYNPDHVWDGDSYYGFTFEAGKKLAEKHGYKVIFQIADMNMIMVRADFVEGLFILEVTYKQNDFFKLSTREDWVMI